MHWASLPAFFFSSLLTHFGALARGRVHCVEIRCYNRLLESPDIQSILNNEVDPAGIMWRSFPAHYDESLGVYKECKVCPACLVLPAMSWLSKVANHLAMLQLDHRAGDPQEDLYHAQRDGNALAEEVARDALRRQREGRGCDALEEPAEKRERARQLAMLALGPDAEAIGGLYRGSPGSSLASASTVESCGKLKALRTLLRIWYREKRPRCKVLLFSNSTIALDLLEAMTVKAGYIHRRIDGQTPTKKRAQIVKEFHDNDAIFLLMLSTRAGGVGLNLTCANIVVIFDPVRSANNRCCIVRLPHEPCHLTHLVNLVRFCFCVCACAIFRTGIRPMTCRVRIAPIESDRCGAHPHSDQSERRSVQSICDLTSFCLFVPLLFPFLCFL